MHWRRKWQPTPVLLPMSYIWRMWGLGGQTTCSRSPQEVSNGVDFWPTVLGPRPWPVLTGLLSIESHRGGRNWSNLACMHALEKEMTTHSSILAWRIPGTREPGGLLSMGLQRVGHDWGDLAAAAAAAAKCITAFVNISTHPMSNSFLCFYYCFQLSYLP